MFIYQKYRNKFVLELEAHLLSIPGVNKLGLAWSHGVGLKVNHKVVDYYSNIHATVSVEDISCKQSFVI